MPSPESADPLDPNATLAAASGGSSAQRLIGRKVGRYTLVSLIGEGGMGAVYLAEQDHPRRQVALKLIRPGGSSHQLLKRFALEAEALGRLQHPGIAQIHEAGAHDFGEGAQPYFAMEYIKGEPLDVYLRSHALGTRQQLELAAEICDAVQHAHQKGLIHRDLKPGNILVVEEHAHAADGLKPVGQPPLQPKILDFGVARATDSDIKTTTLQTDIGQLIGTVPYMSPEQVTGDPNDLDTRSDVYALGVMIYEMLAGKLPYELERKMIHEAVRVIREQEPTRLSSVDRLFRGDVETIVSKALEKDKTRRYQAASALAADIRRYLNDEMIQARPPSAWYQFNKFARRNKALVTAAAIVFAGLTVGASVATWQAIRATAAQKQARQDAQAARTQAAKAEQTASFIRTMLEGIEPGVARGRDTTLLRIILEQTAERADKELADQPEVEGSIRYTLGKAFNTIAEYDRADAALQRAAELQVAVLGEEHAETLRTRVAQASVLANRGRHAQAETLLHRTYSRQRERLGVDHPDTVDTAYALGVSISRQGRHPEAEKLMAETLERTRRIRGHDHSQSIACQSSLAVTLYMQSRYEEAEALLRDALERRIRLSGEDHVGVFIIQSNLAGVLREQGEVDEPERLGLKSLEGMERVYGLEHPETLKQVNNMGVFYSTINRLENAERMHRRALEVRTRTLGAEHPEALFSLNNLGDTLMDAGRLEEGEAMIRQALEARRRTLGPEHSDSISSMTALAMILGRQQKYKEAAEVFGDIARGLRNIRSEKDPSLGMAFYNWAACLQNAKDEAAAEGVYREVLHFHEVGGRKDLPFMAAAYNGMAKSLLAQKYEESNQHFQLGLDMRRRMFAGASGETVYSLNDFGDGLMQQEKFDQAEPMLREAVSMLEAALPENVLRLAQSRCILGDCLSALKQFPESQTLLLQCHQAMFEGDEAGDAPDAMATRERVLVCLERLYERWSAAPDGDDKAAERQRWKDELAGFKESQPADTPPTTAPAAGDS